MVGSTKDVAIIAGILGIAYIIYRGIGGLMNPLGKVELPSINISNPFNFSNPVNTTYPNATDNTQSYLDSIKGGFGSLNTTLQGYIDSLNKNLPALGTPANPANNPNAPTPTDVILNDPTLTEKQKQDALNIIQPTQYSDLSKFNPPNVFGYGILGENKKGIPLSLATKLNLVGKNISQISAQQQKLLSNIDITEDYSKIIKGGSGVGSVPNFFGSFGVPYSEGAIKSNAIVQNTQTAAAKNIPLETKQIAAGGQFGGTVNIQTANQYGGFIGGQINENPVNTLVEVLQNYPTLTGGQAQDLLREILKTNPRGIAPSVIKNYYPTGDIKNISNIGKDVSPQIFGNNSLGINATSEQISSLLMRHLA